MATVQHSLKLYWSASLYVQQGYTLYTVHVHVLLLLYVRILLAQVWGGVSALKGNMTGAVTSH